MKRRAVIVDIDGTLANNDHRRHHVETPGAKKDWKAFFGAQIDDAPKVMVGHAVYGFLTSGEQVIFLTGRAEEYREITASWLKQHFPWSADLPLFMRPDGDFQPDTGAKKHIYETEIAPIYDVVLAIDDRDSVVKLWRDLGIECWQVAAGDF